MPYLRYGLDKEILFCSLSVLYSCKVLEISRCYLFGKSYNSGWIKSKTSRIKILKLYTNVIVKNNVRFLKNYYL